MKSDLLLLSLAKAKKEKKKKHTLLWSHKEMNFYPPLVVPAIQET